MGRCVRGRLRACQAIGAARAHSTRDDVTARSRPEIPVTLRVALGTTGLRGPSSDCIFVVVPKLCVRNDPMFYRRSATTGDIISVVVPNVCVRSDPRFHCGSDTTVDTAIAGVHSTRSAPRSEWKRAIRVGASAFELTYSNPTIW